MESSRLREIKQCAERAGVVLESVVQQRRHVQITLANGRRVFCALSPSDRRGHLNLIRDLKKEWNHK